MVGLVFLGDWLIVRLYTAEFSPAYPAVLILLIGYGFANVLFWNRPLLLSLGMPAYPLVIAGGIGLVKILLSFWLVPLYGYLAQAALLSSFFVLSIGIIVWRGLWEIRTRARHAAPVPAAVS